ncbi:MAG: hypothetical protein KKD63_11060 [Proteobacteria bacterium]|nr:hypothetical protein [Desulfobulbaceae bacterium]MBU4153410.1 hypothetical protein [Pseudomonadota bacterium]
MFKISTGLRNELLGTNCLSSLLSGLNSEIRIYAGTEPASADDSLGSATLLCKITPNGILPTQRLTFNLSPVGGILQKNSNEVWKGTNLASGSATFYRWIDSADSGGLSTTAIRLQGSVGVVNADLLLASTTLVASQEQRIDYFAIGMPGS